MLFVMADITGNDKKYGQIVMYRKKAYVVQPNMHSCLLYSSYESLGELSQAQMNVPHHEIEQIDIAKLKNPENFRMLLKTKPKDIEKNVENNWLHFLKKY